MVCGARWVWSWPAPGTIRRSDGGPESAPGWSGWSAAHRPAVPRTGWTRRIGKQPFVPPAGRTGSAFARPASWRIPPWTGRARLAVPGNAFAREARHWWFPWEPADERRAGTYRHRLQSGDCRVDRWGLRPPGGE